MTYNAYVLGAVDVVGEFCSAVRLPGPMCSFLRMALSQLGIELDDIEGELRKKGKDKICSEIVDMIGADFPGGKKAARQFCDDLLGKLEARLFDGGQSPSTPSGSPPINSRFVVAELSPREIKLEPPPLPVATIATLDAESRAWRVAIPTPKASTADSPYIEVGARSDIPPEVLKVALRDFLRQTGQLPWYKDGYWWMFLGGSAAVLTGAVYLRKQRRG